MKIRQKTLLISALCTSGITFLLAVAASAPALAGCQRIEPRDKPWYDPTGWFQNSTTFCTAEGARREPIVGNWGAGSRVGFRFCTDNDFGSGFPDGEEGIENSKRVVGIHCLNGTSRFSVPSDINLVENWGAGAREAFRYCTSNGFGAGFPDGEEGIENGSRVVGIHCLDGTSRFSVPSDINLVENWGAGAREAFRYCTSNGFGAGFPDGEEGIENGSRVVGIHCLNGTSRFSVPSNISLF